MMGIEAEKMKKAYELYNLNTEYDITVRLLSYIEERLKENKENIEKVLKFTNEDITYDEIFSTYTSVAHKELLYKHNVNIFRREDNFIHTIYEASVGIIGIECDDTLKALSYYIEAIRSRNAIVISDMEYDEYSVKILLLTVFRAALENFGIGEDLIVVLPYEECDYTKCDKVIYTYNKDEIWKKEETENLYIYMEDEKFNKKIQEEIEILRENAKEVILLYGDIDIAIETINKQMSEGTCIYTQDTQKAYKFINLVHSKNVFVNATMMNIKEVRENPNKLYMNKNIMYELKMFE